jgi:hypothetical protein
MAKDAAWDPVALAVEISEILDLEPAIDLELIGFGME